jgi:hypothetical protein
MPEDRGVLGGGPLGLEAVGAIGGPAEPREPTGGIEEMAPSDEQPT